MISKATDMFAIPLPSEPLSFRFDEGGWLLGTVTGDLTPTELAQMAMHDLDVRGREWALGQLATVRDSAAAAARRFIVLNEQRAELRQAALEQMAADSNPATRTVAGSALRDPDGSVRAAALVTLRAVDGAAATTAASAMYATDPNDAVRQAALAIVAQAKGEDALDLLLGAAVDQPLGIRLTAFHFLGQLRDPRALDLLERMTANTEDRAVRTQALNAIAASGDSARATALALRLIGDYDPLFASAAVRVGGRVGGADGRARLAQALRAERRVYVRLAMQQVLAAGR
jgi:HEAT repeat protein